MLAIKIIIVLIICHFISAFLHYYTVLRDYISREKLQIIVSVIGTLLLVKFAF